MKVYLVGGAVRDRLLGLESQEKDWVVVGATADQMEALRYKKVGKDFPVFLHPKTQEEYALARKERKSAPGYYGFQCDFSPEVTLDEDLARRDLTINAMAMDENGLIIDPYHGQADLNARILRHVSPAFIEDPVRVLRVARFAARYYHLGFRVANETRQLMYHMVKTSELNHLVPERVWQEWYKSLQEKNPGVFISVLRSCGALAVILPELDALFGVPNSQKYHPEVDSGIHSLNVLERAAGISERAAVRFAALIHDLGKARTPEAMWPKHHGHDVSGVPLIEALCKRLHVPNEFRQLAVLSSRHHLNIHRAFELRAKTIVKVLEHTDAFRRPELFAQLLLVSQADAERHYPQKAFWEEALRLCNQVSVKPILDMGVSGQAIKDKLHQQRVACIETFINNRKLNEK